MNDGACIVEVNGVEYYTSCNTLEYLIVVDNHLINTYSSNVTLYRQFPDPNVNGSGYPRITANSNQYATLRNNSTATSTTLIVNDYKIINRHTSNDVLLLIVLIGVSILNIFKR